MPASIFSETELASHSLASYRRIARLCSPPAAPPLPRKQQASRIGPEQFRPLTEGRQADGPTLWTTFHALFDLDRGQQIKEFSQKDAAVSIAAERTSGATAQRYAISRKRHLVHRTGQRQEAYS